MQIKELCNIKIRRCFNALIYFFREYKIFFMHEIYQLNIISGIICKLI